MFHNYAPGSSCCDMSHLYHSPIHTVLYCIYASRLAVFSSYHQEAHFHFSAFSCFVTVVFPLEKEAYPEHSDVLWCHIKLAFLLTFYVFGSCIRTLSAILVSHFFPHPIVLHRNDRTTPLLSTKEREKHTLANQNLYINEEKQNKQKQTPTATSFSHKFRRT